MKYINLIIMLIFAFFLVQPASAHTWLIDSDIIDGLSITGAGIKPAVFNDSGTWKMIVGNDAGEFYGFQWNGTGWETNSNVINGLVSLSSTTSPEVFYMDGDWYLITGYSSSLIGYKWNGTTWETDSSIINGITSTASRPSPEVFNDSGTFKLIIGSFLTDYQGYQWNGTGWEENTTIASGLTEGYLTAPAIWNQDGTWYLIGGRWNMPGNRAFDGYYWSGTGWVHDTYPIQLDDIIYGLPLSGYSYTAPEIFYMDDQWQLIFGESNPVFNGYVLMKVSNLRTEGVVNNHEVITNITAPYFTWELSKDVQTNWQIQVGTTQGASDKWNSGVMAGTDTFDIYAGSTLEANIIYYVQARTTNDGITWSAWETGTFMLINRIPIISNLRTEDVVNNHEVSKSAAPNFTWDYSDPESDVQTNWQIQVGTTQGSSNKWDSGVMAGTDTSDTYVGLTLEFNIIYHVQVRVHDGTSWSAWETGTFMILDLNTYADLGFTASITDSQNTALQQIDISFGDMIAGNTLILTPSFNLTNSGNSPASIEATFTTEYNGIYGFVNTPLLIGGGNFSVQKDTGTWDALDNLLAGTSLTDTVLADNNIYNWNARLTVPAGQPEALYTGTIELTFS